MIQTVAEGLEWSYGWEPAAAQRLRFVLNFANATGLRASELVDAKLGMIEEDAKGDRRLHLFGKGSKTGKVALPPMARAALDRYLVQRRRRGDQSQRFLNRRRRAASSNGPASSSR